ncbi:Inner membrane protein YbhN [Planctomycetes bacterium CA13]|uniref:Inner membrane protein YbhN n=1 Tax=Novipirellula herctigrandis TaxID=2527986 RepID=A0A5C5Z458_9BACT|nr:Inner membrane protein YbhN [Planctomycetes bacterium CA13]
MSKTKIRKIAGPAFAAVLFALAVKLLWREAHEVTWEQFKAGFTGVPTVYLAIAAFLIALNYGLLITYDLLALRYVCRSLPLRRVALVSFLGFTLGNNLGTLMAGAPIRFRFYTQWGLTPRQIVVLISICGLTFWSGLWFLGGTVLVFVPIELPPELSLPFGTQALGVILLTLAIGYAVVCWLWRKPWPIGELHLRPPELGLMSVQASVAAVDLLISATALYLVLPNDATVPFAQVLAAYLCAISISLLTQVPGGLGVLEVILVKLLKGTVGDSVLASVLIFRILYYVLPLLFGMITLAAHEIYSGAMQAREARLEAPPRIKRNK